MGMHYTHRNDTASALWRNAMSEPIVLEVGQDAPAVEGAITGGGTFKMEDERGKWVVIYFFPRSNTPG